MQKPLVIIGIALSVVLILLAVVVITFDVNDYRGPIQAQLQSQLGRPVTLGPMDLALFPPRFEVKNLVIREDPDFAGQRPFIQAEQVGVSAKLLPLLRGGVEVTSLDLRQPVIELIKNRQGVWNFSSLAPLSAGGGEAPKEPGRPRSLSLASLSVEDGQVAVTDHEAQKERAVYSNIDLSLKDLAPDTPFSVELGINLPGEGGQEVQLHGTGGPLTEGSLAASAFHGTVDLNNVRLSALRDFLREPILADSDGTITGESQIDLQSGTAVVQGEIDIQDARVRAVELGFPIAGQYSLKSDLNSGRITVEKGTVGLGSTIVSVHGNLETKPVPTRLDLRVKADKLALAEVTRLAPAFGVSVPQNLDFQGLLSGEFQVQGTTAKPELTGTVSASGVRASGKDLPQPIEIQAVRFSLGRNEIKSNDFAVLSGETAVNSRVAVRDYAAKTPVIDARLEAPNARFAAIVAMAKVYGVTALNNVTGNGTLSFKMRLAGPVQSLTGDAVLRALNGHSEVAFDGVEVSGTNLSREISAIAGFLKPTGDGRELTTISKMNGTINIRNGVARTDDLKAILNLGTIALRGTADLVSHELNLRVNAVVDKAISEQAGGTGIRGYMKTALENERGEIVVPVLLTGTFENPTVRPDVQSFAQMKLRELLPTSSNPDAGLPRVIEDLIKGKAGSQEPQQQPSKEENPAEGAIRQILEGLSGQQQKQEDSPPKSGE